MLFDYTVPAVRGTRRRGLGRLAREIFIKNIIILYFRIFSMRLIPLRKQQQQRRIVIQCMTLLFLILYVAVKFYLRFVTPSPPPPRCSTEGIDDERRCREK